MAVAVWFVPGSFDAVAKLDAKGITVDHRNDATLDAQLAAAPPFDSFSERGAVVLYELGVGAMDGNVVWYQDDKTGTLIGGRFVQGAADEVVSDGLRLILRHATTLDSNAQGHAERQFLDSRSMDPALQVGHRWATDDDQPTEYFRLDMTADDIGNWARRLDAAGGMLEPTDNPGLLSLQKDDTFMMVLTEVVVARLSPEIEVHASIADVFRFELHAPSTDASFREKAAHELRGLGIRVSTHEVPQPTSTCGLEVT